MNINLINNALKDARNNDPILRPKDAAPMLGLSVATLALWRFRGDTRLPWVKLGTRSIGYRLSALRKFIEDNTQSALPIASVPPEDGGQL